MKVNENDLISAFDIDGTIEPARILTSSDNASL